MIETPKVSQRPEESGGATGSRILFVCGMTRTTAAAPAHRTSELLEDTGPMVSTRLNDGRTVVLRVENIRCNRWFTKQEKYEVRSQRDRSGQPSRRRNVGSGDGESVLIQKKWGRSVHHGNSNTSGFSKEVTNFGPTARVPVELEGVGAEDGRRWIGRKAGSARDAMGTVARLPATYTYVLSSSDCSVLQRLNEVNPTKIAVAEQLII